MDLLVRRARRTILLALVPYGTCLLLVFTVLDRFKIGDEFSPGTGLLWRLSVFFGAIAVGYVYLLYLTTTLRVAKREITKRSGIITRDFDRVEIDKITN